MSLIHFFSKNNSSILRNSSFSNFPFFNERFIQINESNIPRSKIITEFFLSYLHLSSSVRLVQPVHILNSGNFLFGIGHIDALSVITYEGILFLLKNKDKLLIAVVLPDFGDPVNSIISGRFLVAKFNLISSANFS